MARVLAPVDVRPYEDRDEEAVLRLLEASLGGGPAGSRPAAFFRWKHLENPFGRSYLLVAEAEDRIVGLRAFMRWRFAAGDRTLRAVRAVDTATHPEFQGKGVFSLLTRRALEDLRDQADLVFNTPNEKSLPGYLKMGWQVVGSIPIYVRVRRPARFVRHAWASRRAEAGAAIPRKVDATPAGEALDATAVEELLRAGEPFAGISTQRTIEYLRWRYGDAPLLDYRAASEPGRALAIFRVRPRGALVEATVSELIVRPGDVSGGAPRARQGGSRLPRGSRDLHVPRRLGRDVRGATGRVRPGPGRDDAGRESPGTRRGAGSAGPVLVGAVARRPGGVLVESARVYREARASGIYVVVGLFAIVAYTSGLLVLMRYASFDIWWAAVLSPVLFAVSLPFLRRQALREDDPSVFRFLALALAVKLAGAFLRFYASVFFYGGLRDANVYSKYGAQIAENFRHGHFTTGLHSLSGTDFIRFFTGVVYALTGTSKLGGCVVFSWLGFWGLFFFYRAFRIAVPEARRRTYVYLLFFLPSLVFWPSSIGKDAWMMFTMGLATFGVARLLSRWTVGGTVAAVSGLWLASLVRPHVAALLAVAFVVALVTRKGRGELRELAPLVKGVSVVLAVVLAVGLAVKTSHSLHIQVGDSLGGALTKIEDRTSKGGSDFTPALADSPARFPVATVTVLFRPLIFEAHNTQARLAALESTVLLLLCLVRFRWVMAALKSLRRQPYVVFCLVYVLLFIVAFSSFSNFGLLARERVQLYPLFLVLLAIPPAIVGPHHTRSVPISEPLGV